jgi:hypothetical protein
MVRSENKNGDAVRALLPELARSRIEVFRDFSYFCDGTIEYEQEYPFEVEIRFRPPRSDLGFFVV